MAGETPEATARDRKDWTKFCNPASSPADAAGIGAGVTGALPDMPPGARFIGPAQDARTPTNAVVRKMRESVMNRLSVTAAIIVNGSLAKTLPVE
ncbi:hypothetical protein GCM10017322_08580 [Paracoccus aerius]|nr:hypothetical protein GCM10017322_08580 [Paracoccus aerius]